MYWRKAIDFEYLWSYPRTSSLVLLTMIRFIYLLVFRPFHKQSFQFSILLMKQTQKGEMVLPEKKQIMETMIGTLLSLFVLFVVSFILFIKELCLFILNKVFKFIYIAFITPRRCTTSEPYSTLSFN